MAKTTPQATEKIAKGLETKDWIWSERNFDFFMVHIPVNPNLPWREDWWIASSSPAPLMPSYARYQGEGHGSLVQGGVSRLTPGLENTMAAVFAHYFREVGRKSGNREKCRQGGAQGARHDQLGGWHCGFMVRSQLRKQCQTCAM